MADEQQRAGPLGQLRLEQFERLDVQVVGRFVEHQHVGRAREQPRQQQPVALAAGEGLDRRPGALGGEEEVLQVTDDVARLAIHRHRVVAFTDDVGHGALGIELLALLVVVGHLHVGANADGALVWRELSQQQPQQRRLATAVGSDEPDAVAADHATREVAHD